MLSSEIINSLLRLLFAFVLGEFVLLSKNKLIANTSLRLALRFLIVIWCYIFFTKNLGLGLLVCSIRLGLNLLFLSSKKMANHFARNLMRIEILLSFILYLLFGESIILNQFLLNRYIILCFTIISCCWLFSVIFLFYGHLLYLWAILRTDLFYPRTRHSLLI